MRLLGAFLAALLLAAAFLRVGAHQPSSPDRVAALVQAMTLDEKLSLVHGARDPEDLGGAGYWPGLPRLGIPPLRFADGPPGINVNRDSTAMPAPVALAATFSEERARTYGAVLGREARALRQDVVLAPHVNIVRDPLFRRNHTTFSEDPLLTARLAAAEIAGIQSQGVMAQVKHLAGYNGSDNVAIDERTLIEVYLPPFEAAVRAGVASVMCAYNRINGPWACESAELQNRVLRGAWAFPGFAGSDWGAVHSYAAILNGLDLEMPGRPLAFARGRLPFQDQLAAAVKNGDVPERVLDQAIGRVLRQMDRFGLLDGKRARTAAHIDVESHARIVRGIAASGAVLLKNDGGALPLGEADLSSLVLIGPTAGQVAAGFLGERGYGFPERLVSPLDALRKLAPRARVSYFAGVDLTGEPIPGVPGPTALAPDEEFRWTGTLDVPTAGEYTFLVQPAVGGGAAGGGTVAIDGQVVSRTGGPGFGGTGMVPKKWSSLLPTTDGRDNGRGVVHLQPGRRRVEVTAHSTGEKPVDVRYRWITPEMRARAARRAAELARNARRAVVFAWSGAGTFVLPEEQDELIARVVEANPRTVVVLNTGGPVAMPWLGRLRAVLQMWYPGQEGGWATADVLLGRANPGGRLPVTFPARLEDTPARAAGHPERLPKSGPPGSAAAGGEAPMVRYSEGIFVGYRWYDRQNLQPLFPFGHGLSYTAFEYSRLAVRPVAGGAEVSFTLRNTGGRRGAEVAQVYLGPVENPPVPMAPRTLAAFKSVELDAGRSRRVTVNFSARELSYWSEAQREWVRADGARRVFVGSSSRDVRLSGELR